MEDWRCPWGYCWCARECGLGSYIALRDHLRNFHGVEEAARAATGHVLHRRHFVQVAPRLYRHFQQVQQPVQQRQQWQPIHHWQQPQPIHHGQPPQRIHHRQQPQPIYHGQQPQPIYYGMQPQPIYYGMQPQPIYHGQQPRLQPRRQLSSSSSNTWPPAPGAPAAPTGSPGQQP